MASSDRSRSLGCVVRPTGFLFAVEDAKTAEEPLLLQCFEFV
jgi:hypothetical protein